MIQLAFAGFLAGAAAIALPIVLHLLKRRPTETERFPSFMLLGPSPSKRQTRNNLRRWLVLLLRCLVLLLLALAFAWPYLPNFARRPDSATAALWDNSLSMQALPHSAEMRGKARALIKGASPQNPVLAGAVSKRVAWSGKFSGDPAPLLEWFDANSAGEGASSFESALRQADARLHEIPAAKRRIVLFTDMQALPWKELRLNNPLSPDVELQVISPAKPGFDNVAITKIQLSAPFTAAGMKIGVDAELSNFTSSPVSGSLSLRVGSIVSETRAVKLKPQESSSFRLSAKPKSFEPTPCSVELDVKDSLPADNVRHFALNPSKAPSVLATPVPKNKEDFIKDALAPEEGAKSAELKIVRPREFSGDLPEASMAILREGASPNSAFGKALLAWMDAGGSAVALWADSPDMRAMLLNFGVKARISGKKATTHFGEIDFEHAAFSRFMEAKVGGLFNIRFFNPPTLVPPENARTVASFRDGSPAILEIPRGKGRLIVIASQMDRASTDWPTHPSFLPFWREMLALCRPASKLEESLSFDVGATCPPGVKNPDGKGFSTEKAGCFKVSADGKELYASVNTPSEESNPAILSKSFPVTKLTDKAQRAGMEGQSASVVTEYSPDERGNPLWKPLLALALLLALAELAIANRTAL